MTIDKIKYLGVRKGKNNKKWQARYSGDHLGCFCKLEDAVKAVDNKLIEIYGEGALTNAKMIEIGTKPKITDEFDFPEEKIIDLLNEEWRDVVGFNGLYKVSNFGRIKTIRKYKLDKHHEILRKFSINEKGYYCLSLWKGDQLVAKSVHRLVAEAFVPNPNNYPIINHKNLNKKDNTPENLEFTTIAGNNKHARDNGVLLGKLNRKQVEEIKYLYNSWNLSRELLGEMYGVSAGNIWMIIKGKTWRN